MSNWTASKLRRAWTRMRVHSGLWFAMAVRTCGSPGRSSQRRALASALDPAACDGTCSSFIARVPERGSAAGRTSCCSWMNNTAKKERSARVPRRWFSSSATAFWRSSYMRRPASAAQRRSRSRWAPVAQFGARYAVATSDGCYETKEGQPAGWPSFVHGISIVAARPQRAVERLVDCASERRFAVSRRQAIPPLLIALAVLEAPGLKARRVLEMQKLPVRQNLNVPHVVYLVFFVGAFDHGTVACGDVVDVAVLVVLIRGVVLGVVERRALLDVIRRHEFRDERSSSSGRHCGIGGGGTEVPRNPTVSALARHPQLVPGTVHHGNEAVRRPRQLASRSERPAIPRPVNCLLLDAILPA